VSCLEFAGICAATKKSFFGDPAFERAWENELTLFCGCGSPGSFACNASFRVSDSLLSHAGAELSGDSDFAAL
jgi:hypothetical protein